MTGPYCYHTLVYQYQSFNMNCIHKMLDYINEIIWYEPCIIWAAVRSAMPSFYEKMKNRLRTAEEGADTVVWLSLSDAALKQPSGLFFQGLLLYTVLQIIVTIW